MRLQNSQSTTLQTTPPAVSVSCTTLCNEWLNHDSQDALAKLAGVS